MLLEETISTERKSRQPSWKEIGNLFLIFLKLGATAFGGPVAHIAIMQAEFVRRRKWLSDEKFLDLVGATNLIPGPNSTEVCIHIGYLRAGWLGLIAGGLGFILPSMILVLGFAWVYQTYGTTPQLSWILYGIKPVILAIIAQALLSLGKKSIKDWKYILVFILGLAGYFSGVNELIILFGCGLLIALLENVHLPRFKLFPAILFLPGGLAPVLLTAITPFSYLTLFLTFLKIGSVLYGSGYVLFAFVQADFVERLGWISNQLLVDAIAIGQVTPGPVSTSATFIGYQLGGIQGAIIATAGIFIPAFFFVAISAPLIKLARKSPWFGAVLDGVNVSSLSLMAGVTWQIARTAVIDGPTVILLVCAAWLVVKGKINSTWLVLGGAALGVLINFLR